jgi:excisionase family DNA binding protein
VPYIAYTVPEAAAQVRVSPRTIRRACAQFRSTCGRRGLRHALLGRLVRIPATALDAWLAAACRSTALGGGRG